MSAPAFVHAALDDYGLHASEFRVYCHLARRSQSGQAWPSIASIAKTCRLHEDTVRGALGLLCGAGMIECVARPGMTCLYRITPMSRWHQPPMSQWNKTPPHPNHPPERKGGVLLSEGSPPKRGEGYPPETRGDEVYPLKLLQEVTPTIRAEDIYRAYPLKVGKPKALQSIQRAMKKTAPAELLAKTTQFAELWNGDTSYCPHPTTWFNQERYNDAPETWRRKDAKQKPAAVHQSPKHKTADITDELLKP